MRARPWFRKHAPRRAADVIGQEAAVKQLRSFLEGYRRGQKPLLLHGPPGTGKTAAVHAVTSDLGLEVVELNASDARNKGAVDSLLGAALGQQSLFARGKVILVDEADGLSGTQDRGGAQAITAHLKKAVFPVVITANDLEAEKLKPLKKASEPLPFPPLSPAAITTILERVAAVERVSCEEGVLRAIAHRAGGDARAAINDLQSLARKGLVSRSDVEGLSEREQREAVTNALLRVFKTTSADVALPAFDNVDKDPEELLLWLDENLPREYTRPEDLARGYEALAEADRFLGRIKRWQYYRFYVYAYNLLTAGVALAKRERYPSKPSYKRSTRLLTTWILNQKNARRRSVAEKVAVKAHVSVRRAVQDVVPFLRVMARKKEVLRRLALELELSEEEASWLSS